MKYLLDVNALVALLIFDHEHHDRAETWIKGLADRDEVLLCAWTEMGFIRVALAARYSADVTTARKILLGFRAARAQTGFVNDDRRSQHLPPWVKTHAQVGDGHLLSLAESCGAKLATLDQGIPGERVVRL